MKIKYTLIFSFLFSSLLTQFFIFAGTGHTLKTFVLGYNDEYETPYYALVGKNESPKVIIHGGMHGDEIASYMCCDELLSKINVLNGTLIIIPRLNKKACDMNTRAINMDLNHAFPGDLSAETYEYRLAYELMYLVDSIKPDLILNLHEARNKYKPGAKYDSQNAYGQIVITCFQPFAEIMLKSIEGANEKIIREDQKFNPHYYEFRAHSSLDNFEAKFDIPSYTVETWRGFDVTDRVKLQELIVLQFIGQIGVEFEYPNLAFN